MNTIICSHCDLVLDSPSLSPGQVAKCPRCNRTFAKASFIKADKMFAIAITALMVCIPAYTFPLISLHLLGITEETNLLRGIVMMIDVAPVVSFVVLCCAVVAPLLLTICIAYSSGCIIFKKRPPFLEYILKLTNGLIHWSMLEVYLISLIVAVFKLIHYADLFIGNGLYFFIALLFLNLSMINEYDNKQYWEYFRNG